MRNSFSTYVLILPHFSSSCFFFFFSSALLIINPRSIPRDLLNLLLPLLLLFLFLFFFSPSSSTSPSSSFPPFFPRPHHHRLRFHLFHHLQFLNDELNDLVCVIVQFDKIHSTFPKLTFVGMFSNLDTKQSGFLNGTLGSEQHCCRAKSCSSSIHFSNENVYSAAIMSMSRGN